MKIYNEQNVLEAARARIAFVFDEFETVIVASSSGKDSTVIMELAIEEAERRGRLPLKVMFVDQEAEWQTTIDYMNDLAVRPEVELWWIQIPLEMDSAASFFQSYLNIWGPGEEWMRAQSPYAKTDPTIFGDYKNHKERGCDFTHCFPYCYDAVAGHKRHGVLYGLRVEESPSRRMTLTKTKGGYKGRGWSVSVLPKTDSWRFAPIWDWKADDVWAAIYKFGWQYNLNYDIQYCYGFPLRRLRVSSLIHGIAAGNYLSVLQEVEPNTYEALQRRLPGINTYSHLQDEMKLQRLPSAFVTWKDYREYLFKHLLGDEAKAQFGKLFQGALARRVPEGERKQELFASLIMRNDYLGVGLENFINNPANFPPKGAK